MGEDHQGEKGSHLTMVPYKKEGRGRGRRKRRRKRGN